MAGSFAIWQAKTILARSCEVAGGLTMPFVVWSHSDALTYGNNLCLGSNPSEAAT